MPSFRHFALAGLLAALTLTSALAADKLRAAVSAMYLFQENGVNLNLKPTHLIGGYAQLSYGFNYYGPTGNQRDELVVVRRRAAEVTYE